MSLSLHLDLDSDDHPRARWTGPDPAGATLAQFLETDLGQHRAYCDRILAVSRSLSGDPPGTWTASGNAFALTLGPTETVLAPLRDDLAVPPLTLPTSDFLDAVGRWCTLLNRLDDRSDRDHLGELEGLDGMD